MRFLRYLSRVFLARKQNSCYFCDFFDICEHFGALLGFFAFQVWNFVKFVIFAIFAIFVTGVLARKKNPCYFCDLCNNGDISGPFSVSSFSKSRILLNLLFLRYLRYLSWVFSASKKNPCYFCDFYDICGHFGALLSFFVFLSLEFCYICYFCDICDICRGCFQLA